MPPYRPTSLREPNEVAPQLSGQASATDWLRKRATESDKVLLSRVRTRSSFDQQSVTERARPASLVSLYLLFMSLAVSARAATVASRLTRCLDATSLLAIASRHRVNFDATVAALAQTAKDMNSKYKETSEAGLALSVTLC